MIKPALIKMLKEIKKDCQKLKKENQLTEYGKGQLDLINIILKNQKPILADKNNCTRVVCS